MAKNFLRAAVFAAATAGSTAAFATTNLVTDGNFNSPGSSGGFTTYLSGQTFDNGAWTVTGTGSNQYGGAGVDLIGNYWQAPNNVGGSVDLDGDAPGGISQTLNLSAGTYQLTFYLSGNPDGGNATKTVDVSVGSVTNDPFSYTTGSNGHGSMNYVMETVDFTVTTAGPVTLSFASQDNINSPWGPVIGGVAITNVPEPTTWAMMALGFAGLGLAGWRRKRQVSHPA